MNIGHLFQALLQHFSGQHPQQQQPNIEHASPSVQHALQQAQQFKPLPMKQMLPMQQTHPLPGRFQGVQPTAYGQQNIAGVRPFNRSLDDYPQNTSDPMNFGQQGFMQNVSPFDDTQHAIPPGFFSPGNTFSAGRLQRATSLDGNLNQRPQQNYGQMYSNIFGRR